MGRCPGLVYIAFSGLYNMVMEPLNTFLVPTFHVGAHAGRFASDKVNRVGNYQPVLLSFQLSTTFGSYYMVSFARSHGKQRRPSPVPT